MNQIKYVLSGFLFFIPFLYNSQALSLSRVFASSKKHIPIQIVNSNPNYFFVLRYNKQIHDLTVERRKKPSCEILSFTTLKLDSVNANWFDYENLDYLFFEENNHAFFIFEKVLNTKKTIYLKSIDTLGKSTGFRELAAMDKENGVLDFRFIFKRTNQAKLLIVGEKYYQNSTIKKVALVYDLIKNENLFVSKLPLENTATGYSKCFEYFESKLFMVNTKGYLLEHRRIYENNQQKMEPVYKSQLVSVSSFDFKAKTIELIAPCLSYYTEIKNIQLHCSLNQITLMLHYIDSIAPESKKVYFFNEAYDFNLSKQKYCVKTPIESSIEKQLTFFDGGDYEEASAKNYYYNKSFTHQNYVYKLSERLESHYYKELIFTKTNLETGEVISQKIIPRKTFFFENRTRFKSLAELAICVRDSIVSVLFLDHEGNEKSEANSFNFHQLKSLNNSWDGTLVNYNLKSDGTFTKKIIYKNYYFEVIPLKYEGNQNELIFYLNLGKKEKFATWK